MIGSCVGCAYWEQLLAIDRNIGECRNKAPIISDPQILRTVIGTYGEKEKCIRGRSFPVSNYDAWCGEFENEDDEEEQP